MKTEHKQSVLLVSPVVPEEPASMKLYAQGIKTILSDAGYRIRHLNTGTVSRSGFVSRLAKALVRYTYYPLVILMDPSPVVHIMDHTYSFLAPIVKLGRKRCIITLHAGINELISPETWRINRELVAFPSLSYILFRWSLRQILHADMICCTCYYAKASLIERGYTPENIRVIIHPISDLFFAKQTDKPKHRQKFIILHVGNNHPAQKNTEHVLRTLHMLVSRNIPVRLVKIGDPFTPTQLQLIHGFGLEPAIKHMGQQPQIKIRKAYQKADVLLFPSRWEGCPAPPIEAMASGLPVILSDIPAHREHFSGCAFFVHPDKPHQSAEIIQKLIKHPNRNHTHIKQGLLRSKQYRWNRILQQIIAVYGST